MARLIFEQEHEIFRDQYRRFLQMEVMPHREQWREQGIVPKSMFQKMGEQGFLLTWADEAYGGLGIKDFRYPQIMLEEDLTYGEVCFFHPLHSRLIAPYIDNFGSEEQKKKYLPACARGDCVLAVAMTEPDTGSDLAGLKTTAMDCGDYWQLNGSKTYISNGINADLIVVAAKSDPENPRHLGLFLVEADMAGFSRGRNLKKMGQKSQDTAELFFSDVKIPKANVLGDPHKGFHYLMHGLAEERLIGAITSLAAAQRAHVVTCDYVRQRKAFGKRVADFQNTRFKLAALKTELDMAQTYLDQCVMAQNRGELDAVMAAKAKLYTSELEGRMVDEGVQLHGGAGYMEEYEICRLYTNARISRIYGGTSEIMKEIIARSILDDK